MIRFLRSAISKFGSFTEYTKLFQIWNKYINQGDPFVIMQGWQMLNALGLHIHIERMKSMIKNIPFIISSREREWQQPNYSLISPSGFNTMLRSMDHLTYKAQAAGSFSNKYIIATREYWTVFEVWLWLMVACRKGICTEDPMIFNM